MVAGGSTNPEFLGQDVDDVLLSVCWNDIAVVTCDVILFGVQLDFRAHLSMQHALPKIHLLRQLN